MLVLLSLACAVIDSANFQLFDAMNVGGTSEYPKDLKCGRFSFSNRSARGHLECSAGCFQDGCSVWALDTTNTKCTACQRCVGEGGGLYSATRDGRRDSAVGVWYDKRERETPICLPNVLVIPPGYHSYLYPVDTVFKQVWVAGTGCYAVIVTGTTPCKCPFWGQIRSSE